MERGLLLLGWGEVRCCLDCQDGEKSVIVQVFRMGRVCCCSGCEDGERSVVVQVVRVERGLLLSTVLGWREACCCSGC